jgi:hypothetical protein
MPESQFPHPTGWGSADLTTLGDAAPASWYTRPIAYVTDFPGQGPIARVVYMDTDGHIWELFFDPRAGGWGSADLNALGGGVPAAGIPVAYVTNFPGQGPIARLVYRDEYHHISELFYDSQAGGWGSADLTQISGGVHVNGDPCVIVTPF